MAAKKIVCLGGRSRYFGRALADLIVAKGLAESEITLYDIDTDKAAIMARHGARLAELAGTGMRVRAVDDLADAVDGADFAISSIGGSGTSVGNVYGTTTHLQDLLIPAKYGIYQIVGDTGGPAGMMMGLRNIPTYLHICREMEKRCPDVILFNHSNPMAILCRAIAKYTGINVIGICHGVQIGLKHIAELLNVRPEELEAVWIGTNHYHWFTRIYHQGKDVYPEVRRTMAENPPDERSTFTHKLSDVYGFQIVYPDDDHAIEFYPFLAQVPSADHLPYGMKFGGRSFGHGDDGNSVVGSVQERKLSEAEERERRQADLREYAAVLEKVTLPEKPSDPISGEGLGSLIESISLGHRHVHIVNIPNRGSIPNLPEYANVEIEAVTDSCGVRGIYTGEAPLPLMGMLQKRIVWQEMVVDAGVRGDRKLVLQALLLDEMAIVPEKAEAMLDELLVSSRDYLPQFAGQGVVAP